MPATLSHMNSLPPIEETPDEGIVESDSLPMDAEETVLPTGTDDKPAETPAAPASVPAATEKPAADAETAVPEDVTQRAQAWEQMEQAFSRDPVAFIAQLESMLTPAQAAARAAGQPAAEADPEWDEANFTAPEAFVAAHKEEIKSLPQFRTDVTQAFQHHGRALDHVLYQNALLEAQLSAVLQHADLKLPDADPAAIAEIVKKGKSYKDAFAEVYKPKAEEAVKLKRQAAKPTPNTPRNSGGANPTIPDVKNPNDFGALFRAVKAAAARQ